MHASFSFGVYIRATSVASDASMLTTRACGMGLVSKRQYTTPVDLEVFCILRSAGDFGVYVWRGVVLADQGVGHASSPLF